MEPENSIETILEGFLNSDTDKKFLVIGNTENRYGNKIKDKFKDDRIIYLGYVSEIEKLDVLRKYSHLYFHGHTVGGTNPSLLESNEFFLFNLCISMISTKILENDAFYFNCDKCITSLLNKENLDERDLFTSNNIEKIKKQYSWEKVFKEYEDFLKSMF